ncbi:MAG TPA: XdhC family protein [Thermoanaerobaculia bacterium]|nr:XdhC family protein [Thermoanaerobaculia bacterium]
MRADLLQLAADLSRRGEPFVLAVVTWRQAPSSAQRGDSAIIDAAGGFHGWLGGSCTRPTVLREAQAALRSGKPRLVALAPDPASVERPGVDVFPMTCHSGGSVEIYLEPVLPVPQLLVFGASPIAHALAQLGQAMGYAVTPIESDADRDGFAADVDARREPQPIASGAETSATARRTRYAVVATMGEDDEAAIEQAVALSPAYLGVIASARRFAEMRQTLRARGVAEEALATIRSPAGLDIGARTAEEIALSVLAEIVQLRRAVPAGTLASARDAAAVPAPGAESATAIDPICGMTVKVAGARHQAEHAGQTFYFCCAGCRERFVADPERYATAEARA